ncbi:MAG TPA: phosphoenolpyruvate-utilizing N-terminal domain-containing protein, partial [Negativicutes bacterium]|nr:phosphoenolpyruvate-utilizing N-terminal domain-containing protein [Negativicutes bacterium]
MKEFVGLPGAGGRDLAPAITFHIEKVTLGKKTVEDSENEVQRFKKVQQEYAADLEGLYYETLDKKGEATANIFKAYKNIALDDFFFKKPIQAVREERIAIDYAIDLEKEKVSAKFAAMTDPYMRERA